jgi:hypothetical protein
LIQIVVSMGYPFSNINELQIIWNSITSIIWDNYFLAFFHPLRCDQSNNDLVLIFFSPTNNEKLDFWYDSYVLQLLDHVKKKMHFLHYDYYLLMQKIY